MKLAVVKRRKAGDTELLRGKTFLTAWQRLFVITRESVSVLEPIIDNMTFSECDLTELVLTLFTVLR